MVVVAALAMVATLPGRTHGLGMITERVLADARFEWDAEQPRIHYSDINLWTTLVGGLFCLPCGWLIDRFGLRWMLTLTVLSLAGAVFWMSHAGNLTEFSLAILLTRGFGQSALSVISIAMVGKWFRGRLSLPMAVYSLILSLGFAYAAQLAKPWAEADWRVVWEGIGYCLLAVAAISCLLTREPPGMDSSTGALGDAVWTAADGAPQGFTVAQALRTQAFWVFGLAISLVALIGSGQSLFNESILAGQGFAVEVYYNLITLSGLVGLCVKLPVGWLGQHCPLNRLLTAGLVILAVSLATLPMIRTTSMITIYGVAMGISGTITTVLFFTIWGQSFGKRNLGQIQAVAQMLTVLASALGPRVFAECFDRFRDYHGALVALAGASILIASWSWVIRVPRPEEASPPISQPAPVTALQET